MCLLPTTSESALVTYHIRICVSQLSLTIMNYLRQLIYRKESLLQIMVWEVQQSNCFVSKMRGPHHNLLQRHALCNLGTSQQVPSPKGPQHNHSGDQASNTGPMGNILYQAIAPSHHSCTNFINIPSFPPNPVLFIHFLVCEVLAFVLFCLFVSFMLLCLSINSFFRLSSFWLQPII